MGITLSGLKKGEWVELSPHEMKKIYAALGVQPTAKTSRSRPGSGRGGGSKGQGRGMTRSRGRGMGGTRASGRRGR